MAGNLCQQQCVVDGDWKAQIMASIWLSPFSNESQVSVLMQPWWDIACACRCSQAASSMACQRVADPRSATDSICCVNETLDKKNFPKSFCAFHHCLTPGEQVPLRQVLLFKGAHTVQIAVNSQVPEGSSLPLPFLPQQGWRRDFLLCWDNEPYLCLSPVVTLPWCWSCHSCFTTPILFNTTGCILIWSSNTRAPSKPVFKRNVLSPFTTKYNTMIQVRKGGIRRCLMYCTYFKCKFNVFLWRPNSTLCTHYWLRISWQRYWCRIVLHRGDFL